MNFVDLEQAKHFSETLIHPMIRRWDQRPSLPLIFGVNKKIYGRRLEGVLLLEPLDIVTKAQPQCKYRLALIPLPTEGSQLAGII